MITVTLFRQKDCPACDQAEADLLSLQSQHPHQLAVIDIDENAALRKEYEIYIPVVHVGPYRLRTTFSKQELQVALAAAADRAKALELTQGERYQQRLERGHTVSGGDRFSLWLSRWYMLFINIFLLLYVGLPFLAPVLAKNGAQLPARVIYTIYSPLCHQLSFRSFFLYGVQPVYPLKLAELEGLMTYEEITGSVDIDALEARRFIGNEAVGFKVALCERDVAIWGSMLLFGILFMLVGRNIKAIPWYLWVVLGILPMGFDGTSQLPAMISGFLDWLPARESTPLLRLVTGSLFGITTAWFLFPMIEESMRETEQLVTSKVAIVSQLEQKSK